MTRQYIYPLLSSCACGALCLLLLLPAGGILGQHDLMLIQRVPRLLGADDPNSKPWRLVCQDSEEARAGRHPETDPKTEIPEAHPKPQSGFPCTPHGSQRGVVPPWVPSPIWTQPPWQTAPTGSVRKFVCCNGETAEVTQSARPAHRITHCAVSVGWSRVRQLDTHGGRAAATLSTPDFCNAEAARGHFRVL